MQSNVTYWLDKTVRNFPGKRAYVDDVKELTFQEVYEQAIKLAYAIIEKGLFKKPIAIYMEKSVDAIVSFLAVAYSGNFYSPIDINMPKTRVNAILDILHPELIIINSMKGGDNIFGNYQFICVDELIKDKMGREEEREVLKVRDKICDTDLLYVLFTSGSTGVPKGVTICHRSVIDYIDWVTENFDITEKDIFGNQAPFYFDNSILDIYTTMKTGATMYIIPQRLFVWPRQLLEYIENKKINIIFWVPSALITVSKLRAFKEKNMKGTLTKILFCGEVMPNKHLNIWRKYIPDAVYANLYGPTEITDACTYYIIDRKFEDSEPLPIGKPMRNTDILILNEKNDLITGEGKIGELCVRGSSLSQGYYNNPEKTREVFVQNPLNESYPELIYRTGDLVKYNEYGELIYIARKDFQIKHMGHRIELGEIETAVSSFEEISMSCCLYDEVKGKIVLFMERELEADEVKERLKNMIPEYMIPNRIVYLDDMPINANGKIDRAKLKELL